MQPSGTEHLTNVKLKVPAQGHGPVAARRIAQKPDPFELRFLRSVANHLLQIPRILQRDGAGPDTAGHNRLWKAGSLLTACEQNNW